MCDSVSDKRDNGEGSLAIVEIFKKGVYVITVVVVPAVVVAAAVVEVSVTGGVGRR